jgi:hypothetical protein
LSAQEPQPLSVRSAPAPSRLHPLIFFVGTAVIVGLIGLLAALITWRFHPGPKPPCVAYCPPPTASAQQASATPLGEAHTYKSADFGFELDYPEGWSASTDGSTASLQTTSGRLWVDGDRSGKPPTQLVIDSIKGFDPTKLPDIRPARTILGARVGVVPGTGQVYAATLVPGSGGGQALAVRIPIVAAVQGGLGLVATGLAPFDSSSPGEVGGGDNLDYALTEFRWPSQ